MKSGLLILISAPSGAGKTSLVEAALTLDKNLVVCVSHTTRTKRDSEVEASNYYFIASTIFERMVGNNDFLEHATVFGNRYGTSKTEVATKRQAGQDVILEIDWQGARQLRQLVPEAVSIFILPPSTDALKKRLLDRGSDSPQSIAGRLAEAQLEMSQAGNYDYIIVNDDFDTAHAELSAIITAERKKTGRQLDNPLVKALL